MPFSDEAYAEPLDNSWRTYLRTFLNTLETAVSEVRTRADAAYDLAAGKYSKPAQGVPITDLSPAALDGIVQTDGTVRRAVKLTQADYDAITTKSATTLYVIQG